MRFDLLEQLIIALRVFGLVIAMHRMRSAVDGDVGADVAGDDVVHQQHRLVSMPQLARSTHVIRQPSLSLSPSQSHCHSHSHSHY